MLHRRGLLKGALALLPVPLLPRERSLAVCPASEILDQETPNHSRRTVVSFDITVEVDAWEVSNGSEKGVFQLPNETYIITIVYLDKKHEEKTVRFEGVKELKFYEHNLTKKQVYKQTSFQTLELEQSTIFGKTSWTNSFTVYFNMDSIILFCGDKIFCAIRI